MEAKLKGMKVADLKSILQQANVSFTAKLTKPDLIKKIMETPAAAALAGDNGNAEDDEPDLPPQIDFFDATKTSSVTQAAPTAVPAVAKSAAPTPVEPPVKSSAPTPATGAVPQAAADTGSSPPKVADPSSFKAQDIATLTLEEEAAKRKARAAKWGTTYVDPTVVPASSTSKKTKVPAVSAPLSAEEEEKRKARAHRFGTSAPTAAALVDEEEQRKRKLREERFGPNKKPRVEGTESK